MNTEVIEYVALWFAWAGVLGMVFIPKKYVYLYRLFIGLWALSCLVGITLSVVNSAK